MTLWIGCPTIAVPPDSDARDPFREDPLYRNVYKAFGRAYKPACLSNDVTGMFVPRALARTAEELAAEAAQQTLELLTDNGNVGLFFDCRSAPALGGPAPAYRLLDRLGLRSAQPIALSGQAGAEVAQAFVFLRRVLRQHTVDLAIVSACQCVAWPDSREVDGDPPLGDGAACVVVGGERRRFSFALKLHGATVGQGKGRPGRVALTVERALEQAGLHREHITWSLLPGDNTTGFSCDVLPTGTVIFSRKCWSNIDFGCADVLISLHELVTGGLPPGLGCVFLAGRFGSIGVLLVEREFDDTSVVTKESE